MNDPTRQARDIQAAAADPARSLALSAAAGAGKTKVLVDRYLRLCLTGIGADLDPRAILAITFTRKATAEIQERLQAAARRLASLPAEARGAALAELFARAPQPPELARAAWCHEMLLADPVGLGIETLHAFCQRVLGRFAAEAGLDPRFAVLEEQAELEYRGEALDRLEIELARDPAAAADYAGLAATPAGARARVADLCARRVYLQRWLDRVCPPDGGAAAALARPLAPCLDPLLADLQAALLAGTSLAGVDRPAPAMLADDLAEALRRLAGEGLAAVADVAGGAGLTAALQQQLAAWREDLAAAAADLRTRPADLPAVATRVRDVLLVERGRKLRSVGGGRQEKTARQGALARAVAPVLRILNQADLLDLLADNRSLLRHGLRMLDLLTAAKRRDRVLDFQDLEYLALRLLRDPQTGPQVHFRLDARLDHLLLDEFQDTNRNQWELLLPLLEEILAGGEPPRTALIVGDVKQSIYGFRGAEPAVFGAAGELLARRAGAEARAHLPTNFRSLPAIVETVGALCTQEPLAGFLGAAASTAHQDVARRGAAGEVVFVHPFPRVAERSGHERAAAAVVALVRRLVASGVETWQWDPAARCETPRTLRHEDILILARTKTRLAIYETALRRAGVPFTPAGRGLLARTREVQDVLALLRWLTFPADDIAAATVLRSPLFRVPEAAVQALLRERLAGGDRSRRRGLRDVLRDGPVAARAAGAAAAEVSRRCEHWFARAGQLPLHDLLRVLYREGEVLERFEIAHGEQARFNLLRLLDLALAAEKRGGSLRDFVDELERAERLGGEEEGARPGEPGSGRVRVMTVHGAKGLQAPVVILVDAAVPPRETCEDVLLADAPADGPWVHGVGRHHHKAVAAMGTESSPGPLAAYHRAAAGRSLTEEAHVLYVALTRARDRLYVLGGVPDRQSTDQTARSFLGWLAAAAVPAAPADGAGDKASWRDPEDFLRDQLGVASPVARASRLDEPVPPTNAARGTDAGGATLAFPDQTAAVALGRLQVWTPAPLSPRFEPSVPSRLHDDRAAVDGGRAEFEDVDAALEGTRLSARPDNAATRRGTRMHAWLEYACRLGDLPPPPEAPALRADWDEVRAVWLDPELAWIFRPAAPAWRGRSEVAFLRRRSGEGVEQRLFGRIDRLVVGPDVVHVIDYKTNRIQPAASETAALVYREQLQAYGDALAAVYPGRELRCWLLWTAPAMAAQRLLEVTP